MTDNNQTNADQRTVLGFSQEWKYFDQSNLQESELQALFYSYFKIFPFELLKEESIGADIGCGSGRWAKLIAAKICKLYCVDANSETLSVAKKNLSEHNNIEFVCAFLNDMPIANESLDFAYSLGVLHHIPDTFSGIQSCVEKLKEGAPFLAYLYYAFDNKPVWFRLIWKFSDYLRKFISKLPFKLKLTISQLIAVLIYFPLARSACLLERINIKIENFPLSSYRNRSLYVMRTDALDRFGTRLEQRFTQQQIISMFENAGLENIKIDPETPYWCVLGYKAKKQ